METEPDSSIEADQCCRKLSNSRVVEPMECEGITEDDHQYMCYDKRLESFARSHCIRRSLHRPMAEAGFFFVGPDDTVKCFRCNGKLNRWTHYDNPTVEHVYHFPNCSFIGPTVGTAMVRHVKHAHSFDLVPEKQKKDYVYKKWYSPTRICDSCLMSEATSALYPCGHACFCMSCVSDQDKCPMCKTSIVLIMRLKLDK